MAGGLTISTLNDSSGVLATQNGMKGVGKAWGKFTGATGVITTSFNVSSITRNGTGDYTINFTTAMPDANYVFSGSGGKVVGTSPLYALMPFTDTTTTTSMRFHVNYVSGTVEDPTTVYFMIMGN